MDQTLLLGSVTAITTISTVALGVLVYHLRSRVEDRDREISRLREAVAQEQGRHHTSVASQRSLELQQSELRATASGEYHRGVMAGRLEERKDYVIQVTPYVRAQSEWMGLKQVHHVGFQTQLLVKGCPTFPAVETFIEKREHVDQAAVLALVKVAVQALPHCQAGNIVVQIVDKVLDKA